MNTRLRSTCWHCGYSLQSLTWTISRGACPECGRHNRGVVGKHRVLLCPRRMFWITLFPNLLLLVFAVVCCITYVAVSPSTKITEPDLEAVTRWNIADNFLFAGWLAWLVSVVWALLVPTACVAFVFCRLPRGIRARVACLWSAWILAPFVPVAAHIFVVFGTYMSHKPPWE